MADTQMLSMVVKESATTIKNLIEGWNFFLKNEVVVGITQESNSARGDAPTNAELLYLHDQGSPASNIPPRPVLRPAISQPEVRDRIQTLMRDAAVEAIVNGNKEKCEQNFHKAGMIGRDACKKYITDGGKLAPNAPSTIARKGSSKPLIDTGSMLSSITYAVRKK